MMMDMLGLIQSHSENIALGLIPKHHTNTAPYAFSKDQKVLKMFLVNTRWVLRLISLTPEVIPTEWYSVTDVKWSLEFTSQYGDFYLRLKWAFLIFSSYVVIVINILNFQLLNILNI